MLLPILRILTGMIEFPDHAGAPYCFAGIGLERLQKFLACDNVETSSTEHKSSHFLALIEFDNEAFPLIL